MPKFLKIDCTKHGAFNIIFKLSVNGPNGSYCNFIKTEKITILKISTIKTMLDCFYEKFIPQGHTVTDEYDLSFIEHLQTKIVRMRSVNTDKLLQLVSVT